MINEEAFIYACSDLANRDDYLTLEECNKMIVRETLRLFMERYIEALSIQYQLLELADEPQ